MLDTFDHKHCKPLQFAQRTDSVKDGKQNDMLWCSHQAVDTAIYTHYSAWKWHQCMLW